MSEPAPHGRFVVVPASYVFLLRDLDGPDDGPDSGSTEVLLQLRRNTGYMDDHWAAAAAGHVERGETAVAAAHREAAEELGVTGLQLEFLTAMQRTRHADAVDERIDFFFIAHAWQGEPTIVEQEKAQDLRWCSLDDLPDPVVPHELAVLTALRDGTGDPYSTFGFSEETP